MFTGSAFAQDTTPAPTPGATPAPGALAMATLPITSNVGELLRGEVKLTFRKPVVSWDIKGQKYYVDANGDAFQINYYGEPAVTVVDESGIDPSTGAIASGRFLRFMGRLISLIDSSGVTTVTGVVLTLGVTR
mgnify:CR=1 FL=1